MKSARTLFLFPLFLTGVFCDDVESVSVMEGDSVTLNTDTIIQSNEGIGWKFRDAFIAKINRGSIKISVSVQSDGPFKDRLQLDNQTGVLKIMNIRISDSGPFTLEISRIEGSSSKKFDLIVSGVDEVKSVSVTVGDSVTLNSGTIIQKDDVIEWRFGDLNSLIAEHNRKTGNFSTSDGPDGRFRDRLQLDPQTGSLTIWNIGTEHSGLYEAGIRKSRHTIHKSYSVTAGGERKSVSVNNGYSVTLHTDLTEIQTDDVMQWMFGYTVLAEINKAHKQFSTHDGPDGRFRGRLKLDHQTRSLTITHTRFTDSGLYELKISSSRFTINKRITLTVTGLSSGAVAGIVVVGVLLPFAVAAVAVAVIYHRHKISELIAWMDKGSILSVGDGETITLNPDHTEVHKDDKLLWMFRRSCIAEKKRAAHSFIVHDDKPDGRFEGRLEPDPQTASLTIRNTKTTDTGVYELLIIRSGKSSIKRFSVSVFVQTKMETKSVKEGESVTLESGVTDIQEVEEIVWTCGLDTPLAEIIGGTKKISPLVAEIFKGRLELDHQTGSLTINKMRPTDAGIYMLYKIERGYVGNNLFRVKVLVKDPEEVPFNSVL